MAPVLSVDHSEVNGDCLLDGGGEAGSGTNTSRAGTPYTYKNIGARIGQQAERTQSIASQHWLGIGRVELRLRVVLEVQLRDVIATHLLPARLSHMVHCTSIIG
jgi:hypothetical protein